MTTLNLTRTEADAMDEWKDDTMVCVFCDNEISALADSDFYYCHNCDEYKGIMSVSAWEDYTGERWED